MDTIIRPITDAFALRNSERLTFYGDRLTFYGDVPLSTETFHFLRRRSTFYGDVPPESGCFIGIMRRSVWFPEGPRMATVTTGENLGRPVMFEAIIACQKSSEGWVWIHPSPSTKEILGSLSEDWGAPLDQWYFIGVERVEA